jgi:formate hydrogenlyase subunit 3/multisubunit Na+/H+ antiporter MnhD subunit
MVEALFAVLIVLTSIATAVYSFHYNKNNLMVILALQLLSMVYLDHWQVSALFLLFLAITALPGRWSKMTFPNFITLSMFSAVGVSYLFVKLFQFADFNAYPIAVIAALCVCTLAVFGIMENHLRRFLILSNAIQLSFVVLELSVAKLAGPLGAAAGLRPLDYTIAGLLLFLSLGVFANHKHYISELEGSQVNSRLNDAFCAIACLSLAGLPGFNMFVAEWELFTTAFGINPGIAVLGVLSVVLLFIMYYKVVFVLLVGEGRKEEAPKAITLFNGLLAALVLLLGLVPQLQWLLLGALA